MKFYYRAMPVEADYIRPGDYLTPSRKFAVEHAITTAVYKMSDYGVYIILLNEDDVEPAHNPGELRYKGSEPAKAKLVGIAKYDEPTANAEYFKTSRASDRMIGLSRTLSEKGFHKESKDCLELYKSSSESSGKQFSNLLILVHPDSASELNTSSFVEYSNKVKAHVPKFDLVFTNFLFSYEYANLGLIQDQEKSEELRSLRGFLEASTVHSHDRSMGSELFENTMEELLIENENIKIYLAGGYQDLCLANSYENFCKILGWIVDEMDHEVQIYNPLVFNRKLWNSEDNVVDEKWWSDIGKENELTEDDGEES